MVYKMNYRYNWKDEMVKRQTISVPVYMIIALHHFINLLILFEKVFFILWMKSFSKKVSVSV